MLRRPSAHPQPEALAVLGAEEGDAGDPRAEGGEEVEIRRRGGEELEGALQAVAGLSGEADDQADDGGQTVAAAVGQRLGVRLHRAGLVHVVEEHRIARLDADLHLLRAGRLHEDDRLLVRQVVRPGVADPADLDAAVEQQAAELAQAGARHGEERVETGDVLDAEGARRSQSSAIRRRS